MLVVGLTGGIGSGKTEVSDRFEQHGVEIIDADQLARDVVAPGREALSVIAQRFGQDILQPDGFLRRAELRRIIFADAEERRWLEELLHPLIGAEIKARLGAVTSPYAILVSPLLLESKQEVFVSRVLVVDTSEEAQLERTLKRDNESIAQVKAIQDAQLPREQRRQRADDIVVNDGALSALDAQVRDLHQLYLRLAAAEAGN